MSQDIQIQAAIAQYIPNAMSDDYDDGGFAMYDATLLQILAPESLKGQELTVYHDLPPDADSFWRQSSNQVQFQMESDLLADNVQIFAAAIKNVEILD
jgi:hypothetical protein